MTKRTGRPRTSTRDDVVARLDRGVVAKARYIAETRGIPLAEYLSDLLRPIVAKDFDRVAKEEMAGPRGAKPSQS